MILSLSAICARVAPLSAQNKTYVCAQGCAAPNAPTLALNRALTDELLRNFGIKPSLREVSPQNCSSARATSHARHRHTGVGGSRVQATTSRRVGSAYPPSLCHDGPGVRDKPSMCKTPNLASPSLLVCGLGAPARGVRREPVYTCVGHPRCLLSPHLPRWHAAAAPHRGRWSARRLPHCHLRRLGEWMQVADARAALVRFAHTPVCSSASRACAHTRRPAVQAGADAEPGDGQGGCAVPAHVVGRAAQVHQRPRQQGTRAGAAAA